MLLRSLSFICLLLSTSLAFAQIEVIEQERDGAIEVFVQNDAPCPAVVKLMGELKNFTSSVTLPLTIIVEAHSTTSAFRLERINPLKRAQYRLRYTSRPGNPETASHDPTIVYELPYRSDEQFQYSQGPNGPYSHANKTAYDFALPKRTRICAARSGIVVEVKEDSRKGCADPKCKPHGNYILIMHDDGTFANYGHLKHWGARVKVGDRVTAGEVIAKSGDTGWATAPHLHFELVLPGYNKARPVPSNQVFFNVGGVKRRLTVGQMY